jgi:amidase
MNTRARLVGIVLLTLAACAPEPPLDLVNHNALTLQRSLASGELSAVQLTEAYLERIAAIDAAGPMLRSIIEVNPDALQIARELDTHLAAHGPMGPLHGLPVVLKANIDTGDRMATSAGSLAMADHIAARDAFLVARLRAAGAVILGKTNMSEWANFRSTGSTSGWSSLGGQVRNPYVLDRNPCGSSSGSAVAVAASLAALAVGTETDGSVVCPAGLNGIVGIKPTLGTVSRVGIIPIAHSQDTAGPMAKTVTGAALLLEAMVEADANDAGARRFPDAVSLLPDPSQTTLTGQRIGIWRTYVGAGEHPRVEAILANSIETLRELGAEIIDPIELQAEEAIGNAEFQVLLSEFKADLNDYLEAHNVPADRDSLAELIAYNEQHKDTVMPIFGQEIFHAAEATIGLADPAYLEALAGSGERVREAVLTVFARNELDALIAPTNEPAWKIDWIGGDRYSLGSSPLAAISGYPSIAVPAGHVSGLPIGISFVGLEFSEPALVQMAYAFEQATRARTEPTYIPTLER